MTQQSHSQAYTLRKPKLKKTHISHCSLQHYLQQLEHGSKTDEWIKKWYICTVEYYLAIKRNAFESVLVRWMNLESVIQSEVSHKEKDKYHILMHTYGIQKNTEEFIYNIFLQQWRNRHREQTYGHGERGGEGAKYIESNMESYITMCKIENQLGIYCIRKLKHWLCINLSGWDEEGDGREV